jgi:hypothetical protein
MTRETKDIGEAPLEPAGSGVAILPSWPVRSLVSTHGSIMPVQSAIGNRRLTKLAAVLLHIG